MTRRMYDHEGDDPHGELDMEQLLEDAAAGDPHAQYAYGRELWFDAESLVDYAAAYAWMLRAARKGHGDAWWKLALCADEGEGCDAPDHELAARLAAIGWRRTGTAHCCTIAGDALARLGRLEESAAWYRTGAEAGDDDAMCSLGLCHRSGRGVPRDTREMLRWYVRAARAGSADAMSNLARCRRAGEGVRRDLLAALRWDERAAEEGHEGAAVRLACAHLDGGLLPVNPSLGRAELERLAVEQSSSVAAHELGERLLTGDGLPADPEDAVRWLRWAADMGRPAAATTLGVAFFNGGGLARDTAQAVALYRWAAEEGDPGALRNLGLCHRDGDGVEQDPAEALRLFVEAALRGDPIGAVLAAHHHLSGVAGASPERAVERLWCAAEADDPCALRLLADLLDTGRGCVPDAGEAARLRSLADEIDRDDLAPAP